jgi:hypothetical protein
VWQKNPHGNVIKEKIDMPDELGTKRNWWQKFLSGEGGFSRLDERMLWALLFTLVSPILFFAATAVLI